MLLAFTTYTEQPEDQDQAKYRNVLHVECDLVLTPSARQYCFARVWKSKLFCCKPNARALAADDQAGSLWFVILSSIP